MERLKTILDCYFFSRQKELMVDLVQPQCGERVLNISSGISDYGELFREKRCSVTSFGSSAKAPKAVSKQEDEHQHLPTHQVDDLPYSDDEFDIVSIINFLETTLNPEKAIAEAIRVCRGRIFIGFFNKYSFVGPKQRLKKIFGLPISEKIRFFSIGEVKKMVGSLMDTPVIKWGSVIYFPLIVYDFAAEIEEMIPHIKNPLGAFVGITFPVKYTYQTALNPLTDPYKLKGDARVTAPEAVRAMLKEDKG